MPIPRAFRNRIAAYPPGEMVRGEIRLMLLREPWWAEAFAAIFTVAWAAWGALVAPNLADRAAYAGVASMAPDWIWQTSGIAIGLTQIVFLVVNQRSYRRGACGIAAWWWACLMLLVLTVDPVAIFIPLYALPLAINLFSLARLRREYA